MCLVEVCVCHVVSVGEFYIQCLEQKLVMEQLSLSLSSAFPGPLSADSLKEGQSTQTLDSYTVK